MSYETVLAHYGFWLRESSDMIEHMPVLRSYAEKSKSIVEFGVWDCTSTYGLLAGRPTRMRSYDIIRRPEVDGVEAAVADSGIDFKFILASSLEVEIQETDLLFIDSLHTYAQLSKELELHAARILKFILLHDTTTFGNTDQNGHAPGLWQAVADFLAKVPEWNLKERRTNCHGLAILERRLTA